MHPNEAIQMALDSALKQERQRIADEASKRKFDINDNLGEWELGYNRALRDFADYLREDK